MYKIGVISGKGGVGKSTVTANLAVELASRGYKVGIIDTDYHGPSIPKILGAENGKVGTTEDGKLIPVEGPLGIKIISISYFLPDQTSAVIWRGPLKKKFLDQTLESADFGDIDFLLFDLPPGTGDEALNLAQSAPDLTGMIAVTQPTDVSALSVAKAINFAKKANIRVLGIIENMSKFVCPNCGSEYKIFYGNGGEELSKMFGLPILGRVPIDPGLAEAEDKGLLYLTERKDSLLAKEFRRITDSLLAILQEENKE